MHGYDERMAALTTSTIPPEIERLAGELTQGFAPLGWRGDPRLSLHIGVLEAKEGGTRNGKWYNRGDVVALRVEVHRHNEDGTDTPILTRPLERWHEIIPELTKIDINSPMYKDVAQQIIDHNDALERERGQAIREAVGEQTEHLWKLVADRQNGRTTFRGLPGQNPDKQD